MIISEIGIRGYKSFGNNEQVLRLNTDKGELILLVGSNGNGKSLIDSTMIDIDISLDYMCLDDFLIFLGIMDKESEYILYIKENNIKLYEEYIKYTNQ